MARSNLVQQTCCVNRSRTRSSYSANVSGSTFARIISMSSPNCPRSRIRSSWARASSTVTWTPPFQLRFLTLNTHRTTPGRSGTSSGPKKNVMRNSSDIAPQSTGKSAGESMNLGSASIAGLYSLTECRRSRRAGAERGAYRRVCGAATPKPPVAVERVTPHGRPDAARGVQPGLRGLDGETPSCAGLCGGRTRSKSNGCSGDSMTGPASRLRNQRLTMYDAGMSDTPKYRNRLLQETSPYLLQHAHNPVDWYPWGEEALARAKAENKPILLSIGYSACHWCHVMERESFENPDIAKIMNEHYINIKVDREERPDLDDIYQKSAQAFMRRGGGWPLTVFLTPDQEPFWGGTYFPPTPRYGMPGFPEVLLGVAEAYKKEHEQVQQNVHKVRAGLRHISSPQPSNDPLTEELLDGAVKDLSAFYEPVNGGFGDGPKFPTPPPLPKLLRPFAPPKDQKSLDMKPPPFWKKAAGRIYDHLGGGFHRYSTDGQWLVPHFEKMLYDNAQLVRLYLDGWRLSREPRFKQVVEETLAYIRREMVHPDGGFYTAQDADSEG